MVTVEPQGVVPRMPPSEMSLIRQLNSLGNRVEAHTFCVLNPRFIKPRFLGSGLTDEQILSALGIGITLTYQNFRHRGLQVIASSVIEEHKERATTRDAKEKAELLAKARRIIVAHQYHPEPAI